MCNIFVIAKLFVNRDCNILIVLYAFLCEWFDACIEYLHFAQPNHIVESHLC